MGVSRNQMITLIDVDLDVFFEAEKEKFHHRLRRFYHQEQLEKIDIGSKLVLYGAGRIGQKVYNTLQKTDYCRLIEWVDSNWATKKEGNPTISNPDNLTTIEYDFILIAIKAPSAIYEVHRRLSGMGVPRNKLITLMDVDLDVLYEAEKEKFHSRLCRYYRPEHLEKVGIGSKFILYGAGRIGQKVYNLLQKATYCRVVEWVDMDWMSKKDQIPIVSDPNVIARTAYDFILIAIKATDIVGEVLLWLGEIGVPKEKVILLENHFA